jgi:hypothetical protein
MEKQQNEAVKRFALDVMKQAKRRFVWPGGYDITFITFDGGTLCAQCVLDNAASVYQETRDFGPFGNGSTGWAVSAMQTADWIEDSLLCAHCGRELSPYVESD